jgi:hypothetical protein
MKEEINEELLKNADELLNRPDKEIMALSLGKNDKWAENYQMAMTTKLRRSMGSLEQNIKNLKRSMDISSWVMGIMTFLILVLTGVLVWKGLYS